MIKGFQKIDYLKIQHKTPIGKFWSKVGKIGKNRDFFVGGENLKFFEISFFQHICIIIMSTLLDKNSTDKIVEISAWCQRFFPTKSFVRRKFCLIFQYKSQAKIGQNCRNFGLVSILLFTKLLSDEILSDKILCQSNEFLNQKRIGQSLSENER